MSQDYSGRLKDGIIRIYIIVTVASIVLITLLTGSLSFAVFTGGWVGVSAAVFVNETTDGHTMRGTWIDGRGL